MIRRANLWGEADAPVARGGGLPHDSFSAEPALPYRGFPQTLFDVFALIFCLLFICATAVSLPLALFALFFLEF